MPPVPTIQQLAGWSGRPDSTYGPFANTALFRSTFKFMVVTEIVLTDWNALDNADQTMATIGILAYADNIYLSQPYQQAIASPFNNERIGSYSYGKTMQGIGGSMSRMVTPALELKMEATGVDEFDWAVRLLAHRTRAAGVFTGGITVFEDGTMRYDNAELMVREDDGRVLLFGPNDVDRVDFPGGFDINSEMFPQDP